MKIKPKLRPKVKAWWVKALRSGEYEQGKDCLVTEPEDDSEPFKFCCLGVLHDVAVKQGVSDWWENNNVIIDSPSFGDGSVINCNSHIFNWAVDSGSEFEWSDLENKLATMNDNKNMKFSSIANWIEKNL